MFNLQERRKYKRLEKLLLGRFRVKQYEGQKMSVRDWYSVAVENLSAEGMLFNYNNNLEIDSLLDLEVYTSTSVSTIKCTGKLIRIEESQPLLTRGGPPLKSMFSIATEFALIDEQKKEIINTTVEEILRKEAEKRRFILEKMEKTTNSMTRRVAMAEAKQENTTTSGMKTNKKKTEKKKSVSVAATRNVGIKKEYFKTKKICRVTFRLPKKAASDAKNVCIVGDFNNWNIHAHSMKKLKKGDYTIKLDLEPGREYQFRYFIDESKWENDRNADKYVKSPYGRFDNSVVIV